MLGVVCLVIGSLFSLERNAGAQISDFDLEAYKTALTESTKELCEKSAGVSSVTLCLYFSAGEEYVYAQDVSQNGSRDYVYASGNGLLLQVKLPKVSGAAVICRGGDDVTIQKNLTDLLSSLFGIGTDRIFIGAAK